MRSWGLGSTATAYAQGYLGPSPASPWGADALTVSPYLGDDSLDPFVQVAKQRGAGVFVLVKTSNPGGKQFQDLIADGRPLYQHVATLVESLAAQTLGDGGYGAVGAVTGATYPQQLPELRTLMPHSWFLVPGYGAQGATASDVAGAFDADGLGAIVNSSRAIIFAHSRKEYRERFGDARWQEAVEAATRDMIAELAGLQAPALPDGLPPFAPDAVVRATLRGPGLTTPRELAVVPNTPFEIPPLTVAGLYSLDNIRLESGGDVLLYATPESVTIEVIEKLLVPQVTARPLTAAEIREKGIVFDKSNFQAFQFTAAFAVAPGKQIQIDFPVVLPTLAGAGDVNPPSFDLQTIEGPILKDLSTIVPDTLKMQNSASQPLSTQISRRS